jgi:hypothetical protein
VHAGGNAGGNQIRRVLLLPAHAYFYDTGLMSKYHPQSLSSGVPQRRKLSDAVMILFVTGIGRRTSPLWPEILIRRAVLADLHNGHIARVLELIL